MTSKKTVDPHVPEFATQEQHDSYDRWFRAQVQEAIDDPRPSISHDQARAKMDARIAKLKARYKT